ncbi:MAG: hypothetical protein A3A26_01405 [Candidatus Zambryskibacteria bacterium RIFCSPLOWO2_01_FULL_47_14]|uniref:DUF192 domain-containing protein n=2 Tax=Candidatus Zambryskiibacteriota TaxID=1817925 RepID=A0A1G2UAV1_9BACT|nr:MAG: hypothetical protein A3A26_01405 [Candidatus Zambryskibacteria bacterium RIFCSPLOWO2_01_FULL_47_14]
MEALALPISNGMKDKFFLILGIAIISWSFYAFLQKPSPSHRRGLGEIVVNSKSIPVEIADSDAERAQGLSGRQVLETETGLLFIFDEPGFHGFWMKDMKFPIDIVWLGNDFEVIGVEKNVSPNTYPQVFYPPRAVKYVLELNAGESDMLEFIK